MKPLLWVTISTVCMLFSMATTSENADCALTSIAIHMLKHQEFQPYFEAVETIMNEYEGRPHWGKLHFQTHRSLAPLYPQWDAFQAARARLDGPGTFANEYTERVLGPVG